jgi:PhnB protein
MGKGKKGEAIMTQTIFPFLAYENADLAMDWLIRAFGFREQARVKDKKGRVLHGELKLSGATVMVAQPSPHYQGPKRHAKTCAAARRWSAVPWVIDGVLVMVHDVKAHFATAKRAGATILTGIQKTGAGRAYRCADCEGHRWMFAQQ